uniref:Uncharacterized protein n=1 Tax=Spongospora subterranea TaxID=70186 RepID=A0A0H5R7S3_9EUKA|eukprot:CRZ09866.1 hypothetical protein [Spongospora subterranea]
MDNHQQHPQSDSAFMAIEDQIDERGPILWPSQPAAAATPSTRSRLVLWALLSGLAIVVGAFFWRAHLFYQKNSVSAGAMKLTPPNLRVKPELQYLNYCGLDPLRPETYPFIPPLNKEGLEIIQVQAFIRHGDRFFDTGDLCWSGQEHIEYHCEMTHMSMPNGNLSESSITPPGRLYRKRFINNRNDFLGNCRVGQLSVKGYHQESVLGSLFRDAYVNKLLNPVLHAEEVYFRSDDVPRTILSAESFIGGLFPSLSTESDSKSEIVDIWSMDFDRETEISNAHECPGLTEQYNMARTSPAYVKHEQTVAKALFEQISFLTGVPADKVPKTQFDCMMVSACRGTVVPENITPELLNRLEQEEKFNFYSLVQYPNRINGTRLAAGPLIREIVERIELGVSSTSKVKFSLYSGHDTGPIMLILSALGCEGEFWAPYASYISIELYKGGDGQHFVRVIYNGKAQQLNGSLSNGLISFPDFANMMSVFIPSRSECPDVFTV